MNATLYAVHTEIMAADFAAQEARCINVMIRYARRLDVPWATGSYITAYFAIGQAVSPWGCS